MAGKRLGFKDGITVGSHDGILVETTVGCVVGEHDGEQLGQSDGVTDGSQEGVIVEPSDGRVDGMNDG